MTFVTHTGIIRYNILVIIIIDPKFWFPRMCFVINWKASCHELYCTMNKIYWKNSGKMKNTDFSPKFFENVGCHSLLSFPSHLKKIWSKLRFWWDKWIFFTHFTDEKTIQNNFSRLKCPWRKYSYIFFCKQS